MSKSTKHRFVSKGVAPPWSREELLVLRDEVIKAKYPGRIKEAAWKKICAAVNKKGKNGRSVPALRSFLSRYAGRSNLKAPKDILSSLPRGRRDEDGGGGNHTDEEAGRPVEATDTIAELSNNVELIKVDSANAPGCVMPTQERTLNEGVTAETDVVAETAEGAATDEVAAERTANEGATAETAKEAATDEVVAGETVNEGETVETDVVADTEVVAGETVNEGVTAETDVVAETAEGVATDEVAAERTAKERAEDEGDLDVRETPVSGKGDRVEPQPNSRPP